MEIRETKLEEQNSKKKIRKMKFKKLSFEKRNLEDGDMAQILIFTNHNICVPFATTCSFFIQNHPKLSFIWYFNTFMSLFTKKVFFDDVPIP